MMCPMPPPKKGSDNRDVLSSLPRSRPQRPSARREQARAAAQPKVAAANAKPAAKRAPAKPKSTAPAAKTTPKVPRHQSDVPPAGYATAKSADAGGPPSGAELISTAVQAAGELVQIGATLGSQALKSALSRLPRP
jgi:hypothetical protein